MLERKINNFFPFVIISLLISDFLTSISQKLFNANFCRYSGIVKLVVGVFMAALIITHVKKSNELKVLVLILVTFTIGQFFSSGEYYLKEELLYGNIYFLSRYIYILLFIIFFKTFEINKETLTKSYLFFEYFLWINSFFIVIGLIFHIEIFRSYEYTKRFGYSGLFSSPGEASYLYMLGIIFNFYNWYIRKTREFKIKTIVLIIIAALLGQKKIFLFLFLLAFSYLLNKHKKRLIISIPFILMGVWFFKNQIVTSIIQTSPYWGSRIQKYGILASITSYRSVLLEKTILHTQQNWTYINYIFGGIKLEMFKTEFGFFDIVFFFGLFGIIYYFYIYNLFIKNKEFFVQSLISILFITSFFSGGLLLYPTVIILFYLIINVMHSLSKN